MIKALVRREEDFFADLIERACDKTPNGSDDGAKLRGWEGWLVDHWPGILTLGYWYYIFGELERGHWGGYEASRWINLPQPLTDLNEWRYFFKGFRWWQLTEGTKIERVICRFRGHPNGEVYFSNWDEPDHHCRDCGEEIG